MLLFSLLTCNPLFNIHSHVSDLAISIRTLNHVLVYLRRPYAHTMHYRSDSQIHSRNFPVCLDAVNMMRWVQVMIVICSKKFWDPNTSFLIKQNPRPASSFSNRPCIPFSVGVLYILTRLELFPATKPSLVLHFSILINAFHIFPYSKNTLTWHTWNTNSLSHLQWKIYFLQRNNTPTYHMYLHVIWMDDGI